MIVTHSVRPRHNFGTKFSIALNVVLVLLASLHQCSAYPAFPTSASILLPPGIPPGSSEHLSRSDHDHNNSLRTTALTRRDNSKYQYVSQKAEGTYLTWTKRNDVKVYTSEIQIDKDVKLGSGGYGVVYQGYLRDFPLEPDKQQTPVAVKISEGATEYVTSTWFAGLNSRHIVRPLSFGLIRHDGTEKYTSLVAFERLHTTAKVAWLAGQLHQRTFFEALMRGAMDASRNNLWLQGLNFNNIMSETEKIGVDAKWKYIDLGLTVRSSDPEKVFEGCRGTPGFMIPSKNMTKAPI